VLIVAVLLPLIALSLVDSSLTGASGSIEILSPMRVRGSLD
jgi:hypothetical protein